MCWHRIMFANFKAPKQLIVIKHLMKTYKRLAFLLLFSVNAVAQTVSDQQFVKINNALRVEKDKIKKSALLYQAASYYIEKQEFSKNDIDSASILNSQLYGIGKELNSKKNTAQSMILSGQIAIKRGDTARANTLNRKTLDYVRGNGLQKEEAAVYRAMAQGLSDAKVAEQIKNYQKAIALYKQVGARSDEAETLYRLAKVVYNINGEPDVAIKYALQAIAIKKQVKAKECYKDYILLSECYGVTGDFKNSLTYGLASEKDAINNHAADGWLFYIYNILGVVNSELKFDLKAIEYYKKAIAIAKNNPSVSGLYDVTINTALSLYHIKKHEEALKILLDFRKTSPNNDCDIRYTSLLLVTYNELKQFDKAKVQYLQLLKCDNGKIEHRVTRETMYHAIIKYLLATGQANKTYPYIDKLSKLAKLNDDLLSLAELQWAYYKSDSATGNYLSAIKHLKMFKKVSDSVWNVKKAAQFADLQLKHETEKKDKDITLLKQKGGLQEAKLRNATILRYVFIGGLAVLAIIVTLLYNRSRIRKQNNKMLEIKQQQINEQNDQLRKLLTEKEWLLKEIHHRVKNNLQTVISLLNTQSTYLENKDALMAIRNSQHRMQAISLIHQKLYQSDNLGFINMSWYISELLNYLKESSNTGQKIHFKLDTDMVMLDVSQAVPLGLILNEAICNAIKYAFNDSDRGEVNISLKNIGPDTYRLAIADNGVGLPEGFQHDENESLGMHLMIGLTEQLDGTFEIKNHNGLSVIIIFTRKRQLVSDEEGKITLNKIE